MYLGFFKGDEGFVNIALTIGWLTSVGGCMFFIKDLRKEMATKYAERNTVMVNKYLDIGYDAIIALIFIYFNHYILGTFYILHMIAANSFRDEVEKTKAQI